MKLHKNQSPIKDNHQSTKPDTNTTIHWKCLHQGHHFALRTSASPQNVAMVCNTVHRNLYPEGGLLTVMS